MTLPGLPYRTPQGASAARASATLPHRTPQEATWARVPHARIARLTLTLCSHRTLRGAIWTRVQRRHLP